MHRLLSILLIFASCTAPIELPNLEKKEGCNEGQLLLGTAYHSFDELKECIDINYTKGSKPKMTMHHYGETSVTTCSMSTGVSEKDMLNANSSNLLDKTKILFKAPLLIADRIDLQRAYLLSRRRPINFGANDIAFYDLAIAITNHIDRSGIYEKYNGDFGEKGFINTFNHFISQAFITSIFSKRLADFIADAHELARLPELVTGQFSKSQLEDLKNGPLDNYVDLLNNEWGQAFGEQMQNKYDIDRSSHWTPELMASYLNEVQSYASKAFDIGFEPFRPADTKVILFADKINAVMTDFTAHSENLF